MSGTDGFYTMKGYSLLSHGTRSSAMEDYLEMIARIRRGGGAVRVVDLSARLHVKAPSATKMIQQLARSGLVRAKKYGDVELTEQGIALGNYLLYRHEVVHRFLRLLNRSEDELEQVEKIEHFLSEQTVRNLEILSERMREAQT